MSGSHFGGIISVNDVRDVIAASMLVAERGARLSPLFLGPPGIGKTATVAASAIELAARLGRRRVVDLSGDLSGYKELAAELGVSIIPARTPRQLMEVVKVVEEAPEEHFVYLRLVATHVTPEDLQYPRPVSGSAIVNMPPAKLYLLTIPGVRGILFIDEITNVKREDAKTMFFAIVNEGSIGLGGDLADGVVVAAAGNTSEESSIAEPLPAPLVNRFAVFQVRPPTVEEFVEWYARFCRGCADVVPAYLMANPSDLYVAPKEPEGFENYPTPRTWTKLGATLPVTPERLRSALAVALLGRSIGSRFASWLRLRPPAPRRLLEKPELVEKLDFNTLMLALAMTARYVATVARSSEASDEEKRLVTPERVAELAEKVMVKVSEETMAAFIRMMRGFGAPRLFLAKIVTRLGIERLMAIKEWLENIESQF